jgi:nitrite reductase (NADH) large subunit
MSDNPRPAERLVVVGNGMAAMRTVETLLSRAPRRYDVTVIGAEPHPSYNRILLSAVLAGERTFDDAVTHLPAWYNDNGVRLLAGHPVTAIDRNAMTVAIGGTANAIAYDKLLLATGSRPLAPPIPGLDVPGVRAFRDIADTAAMIAAAKQHRRALVIGGGLFGLEAAWGLRRRAMQVAVVHLMPTLMERQLDMTAGEMLRRDLEARGIVFFTNCQAEEITGGGRAARRRAAPRRRSGRRGDRYPTERRFGGSSRSRRQSRHPGRRRHAHERPQNLRGRRVRRT